MILSSCSREEAKRLINSKVICIRENCGCVLSASHFVKTVSVTRMDVEVTGRNGKGIIVRGDWLALICLIVEELAIGSANGRIGQSIFTGRLHPVTKAREGIGFLGNARFFTAINAGL